MVNLFVIKEQDATIRQHLAEILEQEKRWMEAAAILSEIPFDNGQKYIILRIILNNSSIKP